CLPREAVVGVRGGGIVSAEMTYDEAHIEKRSRAIAYAIDARRQKYPDEAPFVYEPFAGRNIKWDQAAREALHDYSVMDMSV
ncbi:MAG: phytanoyl-CoA dioxygenase, partial [Pseudomonadota bacterium]|nr:phytanoyl-CoA dioxygenase [Pseudomonadota bacterium]